MSLGDVVREAAARYGDAPVYVTTDHGAFSYAQLDRLSESVASGLSERGVGIGDVVAVLVGSGPRTRWRMRARPSSELWRPVSTTGCRLSRGRAAWRCRGHGS